MEYASLYSQTIPNLFEIGTSSIWVPDEQKFLFTKSDNSNFLYSVFSYEDFEFLSKRKNPADHCGLVQVGGMNKYGQVCIKIVAIGG